MTMHALDRIGLPYRVIVEDQEHDEYAAQLGEDRLIVLPHSYKQEYDVCTDEPGGTGSGPARNVAWDTAEAEGHPWHWVMDDNIRGWWRLHRNRRIPWGDTTPFDAMEDYASRWSNVAMAGPQYRMFAPSRHRAPALVTGTRIYSCNLIRTSTPFRWRLGAVPYPPLTLPTIYSLDLSLVRATPKNKQRHQPISITRYILLSAF